MARTLSAHENQDREERILEAVLQLLVEQGIAGVSIRGVAKKANVALGLVNYYFQDKHNLICAALRRIEELDVSLVDPGESLDPKESLKTALRRIASPEYVRPDYLMLRMQVWALAQVHEDFAEINTLGHNRYREGLAELIGAAMPNLDSAECDRRAVDIDLIQNGMWLTVFLGLENEAVQRATVLTEEIAFA